MYKIIDNKGIIYSGSEEEMDNVFSIMTRPDEHTKEEVKRYAYDWEGDLELVNVITVWR